VLARARYAPAEGTGFARSGGPRIRSVAQAGRRRNKRWTSAIISKIRIDGVVAGMATKKRYYTASDSFGKTLKGLKRLSRASQREHLLYWFYSNFEDPAEETPYETAEGGYKFVWGGPYDAAEQLWSEFEGIVSDKLLDEIVAEVESDGISEWAPGHAHAAIQQRHKDAEEDGPEGPSEMLQWRPSQGVIIAPLRAGERFGKPLQEPAHLTPRYPLGIKNSDLRQVDQIIQRETALWWFYLNFERYDLDRAGPLFSLPPKFGLKPYQTGITVAIDDGNGNIRQPTTLVPLKALEIMRAEFATVLPDEIIEQLGFTVDGDWMWKTSLFEVFDPPIFSTGVLAALPPVFDALAGALKALPLSPSYGGIGHNNPPDAIPLTEEERNAVVAELVEARTTAENGGAGAAEKVTSEDQMMSLGLCPG
jgi:hypothetical protein